MKLLYVFLLCSLLSFELLAAPKLARKMQSIFKVLSADSFPKSKKNQQMVTASFDFYAMSLEILGSEAKRQSPDEVKWFSKTIQNIVTRTVYPEAPNFFQGVKISYEDVEKIKSYYTLLSVVSKRGEETEVLLTFKKSGKEWRIIDVALDDESWVGNIREQVLKTLKKDKWKGLKKSLNKRLHDLGKKG